MKELENQEEKEQAQKQLEVWNRKGSRNMGEEAYKTMGRAGAASITIGVILLVTGIVTGIISIVAGASLLKNKSKILF